MTPLAPIANLLTGGTDAVEGLTVPPEDYDALFERTTDLERTVAELQVEIVRLREIERDYERLSGLLNYAAGSPNQLLITADVIARDTSSYLRWIVINRGARDGIVVGAPVITDLGLVGRVEQVAANQSWVRLANDPGSLVNARLQNARAEGTVSGKVQGTLEMNLIPNEAVVEQGDLVLTSGLGGTFPANIVIGQVTSVNRLEAALFQSAEVRPTVDYNALDIVAVITSFIPTDTSEFDDIIEEEGTP